MRAIDREKIARILEAFAYIAEKAPAHKKNMYNVLKVFYLADKLHMERFGRFIFDDSYSAMPKGPVPSLAYDLIKKIRVDEELPGGIETPVSVGPRHVVEVLRQADEDFFSGSDLMCIDEIIELSDKEDLGDLSHDNAWSETAKNRFIPEEAIIQTLNSSDQLLDLHRNRYA